MAYRDKLKEGQRKLNKAGTDGDLLESALLSFHGALEDYFREELATEINRFQQATGKDRAGWIDLVKLWEKHRTLSAHDKDLILAKNRKRSPIAHGGSVPLTQAEVESYAQFVYNFVDVPYPTKSRIPFVTKKPSHSGPKPFASKGASCLKRLLIAIFLLGLIMVSYVWTTLITLERGGRNKRSKNIGPEKAKTREKRLPPIGK